MPIFTTCKKMSKFDTMNIPSDPFILLSFINTKLRDEFNSLDELCLSLDIDKAMLCARLGSIGYVYDKRQNRFC